MKKLFNSLFAASILMGGLFAVSTASANNDCKEVQFDNETVCVSIEKVRTDRFELITENVDGTAGTLRCDIMTPDSALRSIPACNGEFTFDDSKTGRIKLRIRSNNAAPEDWDGKPSSSSTWTYPQWIYDFDNEEWGDDNLTDGTSNYDTDNFYITASPSDPNEDEYVDVTVRARDGSSTDDNYRGMVRFKVERKSGSSWVSASSSYYTLARTSYTFTSSDDGIHTFSNLVRFRNDSYDYRLVVYDDDDEDIEGTKIFYFNGDSGNDATTDNFDISASPSDPDEDEYVDITVTAQDGSSTDDNYRGTVRFKVERKSGSSWVAASSSYYTLARTSYTFTSSDDGEHEFSNLVRFRNDSYDYKLVVYDDDDEGIDGEEIFYFNGDNNDSDTTTDNFYLTTDDTSPSTVQRVDLGVKARDGSTTDTEYNNDIVVHVYYRTNTSSWIETTSSTYFEINSTYDDDYQDGISFSSNWNGNHTFSDFIRFKRDYQYKVVVEDADDDDISGEKIFDVVGSSYTSNDTDNFYVTTDDTTPSTTQRVDLGVKARDGTTTDTEYSNDIVIHVYYRTSTSNSWIETTSSTYFEIDSDYDTSYDDGISFSSSWDGNHTFSDFIKFKKNYQYKVVVEDADDDDITGYKTFNVGTFDGGDDNDDDTTSDNFYLTTDDTTPTTSQYVDLTVRARDGTSTNTSYRGTIKFYIYYKASGSSSWTRTTSSTYYTMNSSYTNGYTFTSSNNGQKTFADLIKFRKNNYSYKVLVYDDDDEDIEGEKIFTVGTVDNDDESSVDGFTTTELSTVRSMYNARPGMINDLEDQYSKLRNSTTRQTRSDNFYDDMEDILDDASNREYDTYDEYYAGFLSWYRYTLSIR